MKLTKRTIKIDSQPIVIHFTKWFAPYEKTPAGYKTTLHHFSKAKRGVYAVYSKRSKKIVYVGHSLSILYKTIYRHFQTHGDHPYRTNFQKSGYLIKVILSRSSKIPELEKYYILKYRPTHNTMQYKLDYDVTNAPDISTQKGVEYLQPTTGDAPF